MRHRILLHTNPCHLKTGLAENARTLLKYLYKTGKYDIAHYCSQVSVADPALQMTPWKSFGCLPADQKSISELNQDPGKARNAAYGAWNIDNVIKEWKPTIYIGSDDIWGFGKGDYLEKPWWKKINSVLHITVDSLPVLEQAYEQAESTKYFTTWAKFAMNEMKKRGPKFAHTQQIYGAMDTGKFAPVSADERANLRKRFNLDDNTTVFLFVGRNQLRKQFVHCIEAFGQFKRENPTAKVKLWFHTSYSEKGQGWDIPKMAAYYGVNMEDILATYICKKCGNWIVHPYVGEDVNCPICKAEKSLITVNIVNGVPDDEMKYVYAVSDACISAFSSGGLEYHNVQSLLCAKPLASTNYSSGQDFCEQPFVYSLGYTTYIEQGTNFIKATTNIKDIKSFMLKVWRMNPRDLAVWGQQGRDWAVKTFSIEMIGAQWEALFDSMPPVDWENIDMKPQMKNDQFPYPEISDSNEFITSLYSNILKMDEPPNGEGRKHWMARLAEGMNRQDIYNYFISVARGENQKNGATNHDFAALLDKNGKKRGLILIKESIGDILITTSLFESFHKQHPDTDLYVMVDEKYKALLDGNPYVHKTLPYIQAMEQEMLAIGAGQPPENAYFDVFYHPAVQTQRVLSYLSQPRPAFDLDMIKMNTTGNNKYAVPPSSSLPVITDYKWPKDY